jgi:hypothetical protein
MEDVPSARNYPSGSGRTNDGLIVRPKQYNAATERMLLLTSLLIPRLFGGLSLRIGSAPSEDGVLRDRTLLI